MFLRFYVSVSLVSKLIPNYWDILHPILLINLILLYKKCMSLQLFSRWILQVRPDFLWILNDTSVVLITDGRLLGFEICELIWIDNIAVLFIKVLQLILYKAHNMKDLDGDASIPKLSKLLTTLYRLRKPNWNNKLQSLLVCIRYTVLIKGQI